MATRIECENCNHNFVIVPPTGRYLIARAATPPDLLVLGTGVNVAVQTETRIAYAHCPECGAFNELGKLTRPKKG